MFWKRPEYKSLPEEPSEVVVKHFLQQVVDADDESDKKEIPRHSRGRADSPQFPKANPRLRRCS